MNSTQQYKPTRVSLEPSIASNYKLPNSSQVSKLSLEGFDSWVAELEKHRALTNDEKVRLYLDRAHVKKNQSNRKSREKRRREQEEEEEKCIATEPVQKKQKVDKEPAYLMEIQIASMKSQIMAQNEAYIRLLSTNASLVEKLSSLQKEYNNLLYHLPVFDRITAFNPMYK